MDCDGLLRYVGRCKTTDNFIYICGLKVIAVTVTMPNREQKKIVSLLFRFVYFCVLACFVFGALLVQ